MLRGHGTQTKIPGTTLWKEMFQLSFEGSQRYAPWLSASPIE